MYPNVLPVGLKIIQKRIAGLIQQSFNVKAIAKLEISLKVHYFALKVTSVEKPAQSKELNLQASTSLPILDCGTVLYLAPSGCSDPLSNKYGAGCQTQRK